MAGKPGGKRASRGRAPSVAQKIMAAAAAVAITLSPAAKAFAGEKKPLKPFPEKIEMAEGYELFTPVEKILESGLSIQYHKDNLQVDAIDQKGNTASYVLESPILMEEMGRYRDMVCKELYNVIFYDNIILLTRGAEDILAGETLLNWLDEGGGDIRTTAGGTLLPFKWVDKAMGRGGNHSVYFLGKDGTIYATNVLNMYDKFYIIGKVPPGASAIRLIDGLLVVARPGNGSITVINPETGEKTEVSQGKKMNGSPQVKEIDGGLVMEFENGDLRVEVGEPGNPSSVTSSLLPSSE